MAQGKDILAERSAESGAIMTELHGVEARIVELDAQIQNLMAQKASAIEERDGSVSRLETAQAEQQRSQGALEELKANEDATRVRLEDARQDVKTLQRKRTDIEKAMERAREALMRQRASAVDIEKTIAQIRSTETGQLGEGDTLLF